MAWLEFATAGVLFLLTHRLPTLPEQRLRLVRILGERGFLIGYSLLSLLMLGWLIIAAGRAPYVALWPFAHWQAWVPFAAMPVVCLLVALFVGTPNPLSFGGGESRDFDPAQPGPVGFVRHGLLWALAIWSAAHIVPNGNLAHGILFGMFAVFSLLGMVMIDRRKRRQLGGEEWQRLASNTAFWPGGSLVTGRWVPRASRTSVALAIRVISAGALFAVLIAGHEWVIGVSPWPKT